MTNNNRRNHPVTGYLSPPIKRRVDAVVERGRTSGLTISRIIELSIAKALPGMERKMGIVGDQK